MIKVLIADDHAIVRQGLKQILAEALEIQVAGEAANGVDAVRLARTGDYDVVVLDVSMPDKNGLDVLKQIKKDDPKLPVLMLSMHPEDQLGVRAIKEGAAGYLSKQSAPEQLISAIQQVAAGRKYISPALAEHLANAIGGEAVLHDSLSTREYQTLCLIASGKTLTAVGEELKISVKTVSVYRARLLEKMHMKNNAELTHYAIKHNLIDSST
jgi:two-component system, NarL family, invasion response regulator UvrY